MKSNRLPLKQVPVTLLEYSMSAVTEGIDAIATTRVLIRAEAGVTSTHSSGETVNRTFRYVLSCIINFSETTLLCSHLILFTCYGIGGFVVGVDLRWILLSQVSEHILVR